jgi:hypothetical protein
VCVDSSQCRIRAVDGCVACRHEQTNRRRPRRRVRHFLVGLSRRDSANRLAAGVADLDARRRRRTRDALVLSTFVALLAVACGSSEGATDAGSGARTPEQVTAELNITADDLGASWEEVDREPVESSELLPECHVDHEVDATVLAVEFENATEGLGAVQLVGVFDSSADASAFMDLWQDDSYTCIDENVVMTDARKRMEAEQG